MTRLIRFVAAARRRRRNGEEALHDEGFTLIELLVVLLIIGILLAIAIPTFLSATKTAGDTAAQSNLQSALTNAKTYYLQNSDSYTNVSAGWTGLDSGIALSGNTGANASTGSASLSLGSTSTEVAFIVYSPQTAHCWGILDDTTGIAGTGNTMGIANSQFPATVFFNWASADGTSCLASSVISNPAAVPNTGNAQVSGWPKEA